jgi:YVTN family beta-propeller protein
MMIRASIMALTGSALLAACGGSGPHRHKHEVAPLHAETVASAKPIVPPAATRPASRPPDQALVTAETENRLLVVELPSGRVVRRIALPRDPEDLATEGNGGAVVVVSAAAGQVTLLNGQTLRPMKVIGGLHSPHIAAIAPDGAHAYVTDDARGTVTVIDLANLRVTTTIHVGAGAHHLCFDITNHLAWVALGESARNIVVLGTENLARPRVIGHARPGFRVHDLACSPDSGRVWLTSAGGRDVTLVDGFDQRVLFRVPVGPPPQHVALTGGYAYLTSGYGSTIEQVDAHTGRILRRASTPYGSFELAADSRYVVVSSLLRGTLAIFTPQLELLRVVHLAPATREVALSSPAGSRP